MSRNHKLNSHHQKIVHHRYEYDKNGEIVGYYTDLVIPKIIKSDIGFQLIFGFTYPKETPNMTSGVREHSLNQTDNG